MVLLVPFQAWSENRLVISPTLKFRLSAVFFSLWDELPVRTFHFAFLDLLANLGPSDQSNYVLSD